MTKKCDACNAVFETTNKAQRFCSDKCRFIYYDKYLCSKFSRNMDKKIRLAIFARDNFRCYYCGKTTKETTLQIDHVFPFTNGSNIIGNIVTSCVICNGTKANNIFNKEILFNIWNDIFVRNKQKTTFEELYSEWKVQRISSS